MSSDLEYYFERIETIEQQLTAVMKGTRLDEGWNNLEQIEINKLIKEIKKKYPLEDRIKNFELCEFNSKDIETMYGQVEFMKTVVGKLKDVLSSSKLIDTDKTKLPTFVNSQDEIEVVKNSVFVIMAMGDPENDKEYEIIKSECKKLGLNSTRVDELAGSYSITEDIIIKIIESEFIIADLTYDRPNVYYELGFAHGIGHEGGNVLLIAKKGTEPHFDLAHLRIQYYESFEDLHTIVYDQMEKLKDERDKVPND